MDEKKDNCWEITGCGREPGGANTAQEGLCNAAIAVEYDKANRGHNSGRCCWVTAGILARPIIDEESRCRVDDCGKCGVLARVLRDEWSDFDLGGSCESLFGAQAECLNSVIAGTAQMDDLLLELDSALDDLGIVAAKATKGVVPAPARSAADARVLQLMSYLQSVRRNLAYRAESMTRLIRFGSLLTRAVSRIHRTPLPAHQARVRSEQCPDRGAR